MADSKERKDFQKNVIKYQNEILTKFEKKSMSKALKTKPKRDLETQVDLPQNSNWCRRWRGVNIALKPSKYAMR